MKTIDFSALNLQDALDLAILVEKEAAERYGDLAAQMEAHDTPAAAEFFRFMIKNELKHGEELAARRATLFGSAPSRVDESMLWEVEAPSYDKVSAFMTARQALYVALEAEEKAYGFFVDALAHVTDPGARRMMEELRDEEVVHKNLVQKQLDLLPTDPAVSVDELADEPVAQ